MRNINLMLLTWMEFKNHYSLSKINDKDNSIKLHAWITTLGYILAIILFIGYFTFIPLNHNLLTVNSYIVSVLFCILIFWNVLKGFQRNILFKSHDIIFTVPIRRWQTNLFSIFYQYIIQVSLCLLVIVAVESTMTYFIGFDFLNLFIMLLIGFSLPIWSIALEFVLETSIKLIMIFFNIRSNLLVSISMILICISPIIYCYIFLGMTNLSNIFLTISPLHTSLIGSLTKAGIFNLIMLLMGTLGSTILLLFAAIKMYVPILNLYNTNLTKVKNYHFVITPPIISLLKKEYKSWNSSLVYITNTIISPIMLFLISILVIFKRLDLTYLLNIKHGMSFPNDKFIYVALLTFVSLTTTTSSSISLEGRERWIMQVMPISIIKASIVKMAFNFILFLPGTISAILSISIDVSGFDSVIASFNLLITLFFITTVGLFLNLKYPNYSWSNEMEVVKQGAATLLTAITSMILIGITFVFITFFRFTYLGLIDFLQVLIIIRLLKKISIKRYL